MSEETASNTGAQTPMRDVKAVASGEVLGFVDYISCTFPYRTDSDLENLIIFLGGIWFETAERRNGYTRGLRCGDVSLWYGGRQGMGIHLQVPGRGCRQLEETTIKLGWPAFFEDLLEQQAKFVRLDIAIDDKAGIISFDEIVECCLNGLVVCRAKTFAPLQTGLIATGKLKISGFLFGSRYSNTSIRIYDKALEQGEEGNHIRVELETKNSKAHKLATRIAKEGEGIIAGVIAATVDFKVAGTDSHKGRLMTIESWRRLIGDVEKIHLTTAPSNSSLDQSMLALEHQYGMIMAKVVREYGEPRLLKMAHSGEIRLKKKEFKLAV